MLERLKSLFHRVKGLILRRGARAAGKHGPAVLRDIAERNSCPVQDVSSRLSLPIGTVFGVVAELERRGLVRVSNAGDGQHKRIVAVTTLGREEARR
jgi:DNA-binding MarR family transcriptional regulator